MRFNLSKNCFLSKCNVREMKKKENDSDVWDRFSFVCYVGIFKEAVHEIFRFVRGDAAPLY